MSWHQYRRLFLILLLPLLLMGYVSSLTFIQIDYQSVLCDYRSTVCHDGGHLFGRYHELQKSFVERRWFDVTPATAHHMLSSGNYLSVESSRSITVEAKIIDAGLHGATHEELAKVKGIIGRKALVTIPSTNSIGAEITKGISDYGVEIECYTLRFEDEPGIYFSFCGNGWIKFTVSNNESRNDRAYLDSLEAAINQQFDRAQADYREYQMVVYPLFVYAFLILSLIVWVIGKAVSYVRHG